MGDEFPDVITVGSIGKSWEDRDLLYIKLDARQAVQNRASNGSVMAQDPSNPISKPEKRAESGDDDAEKLFGANVGNIFLQVDQEVRGIKQSLGKNLKLA